MVEKDKDVDLTGPTKKDMMINETPKVEVFNLETKKVQSIKIKNDGLDTITVRVTIENKLYVAPEVVG